MRAFFLLVVAIFVFSPITKSAASGLTFDYRTESLSQNLWEELQGPSQTLQLQQDDSVIRLSGDDVRSLIAGKIGDWGGGRLKPILDRLQGVVLTKEATGLQVEVDFSESFTASLLASNESPANFQLYAIQVPKRLFFRTQIVDGVLNVLGLDAQRSNLTLLVQIPFLPDAVVLRSLLIDLNSGEVTINAGVIGDTFSVIAHAQVENQKFEGLDLWETLAANAILFQWPLPIFSIL